MLIAINPTFVVLYLFIFGLIGPLSFWLSNSKGQVDSAAKGLQEIANTVGSNYSNNKLIQGRISLGNKVLITADNNPDKQAGVLNLSCDKFTLTFIFHLSLWL